MSYLLIAQWMAVSAFLTLAAVHLLIWIYARRLVAHLLFAMMAAAGALNAMAETAIYRSDTIPAMGQSLQFYVASSGLWAIATVFFIASYTQVGKLGQLLTGIIASVMAVAIVFNFFSPTSFLYTEITSLREIILPWGEKIHLATGENNPWRIVTELALVSMLGVVLLGCYQLWRRKEKVRAVLFGLILFLFMVCFGTHAFFVDTGQLNSPYLSTYGFLALVGLTSFDLAGEVMRISQLSAQLQQKEKQLKHAVAEERNRIAGDLHDSVTQTLFSTAAIADALPEVWKRDSQQGQQGLQDLKHLTKAALAEMRTLLLELHPASLVEKDFGTLLQQLANATAGRTRLNTDVNINCDLRFPDDVQIALYRTAQEALNNIVKHSEASQVWLSLSENPDGVVLIIADDGRGFDINNQDSGMGLSLMQQRIQTIGGDLQVDSKRHSGTKVRVHWPASSDNNGSHEV